MSTAQEIKQAAHQLIDSLPEDATWETLLYTLQVRYDIEAGMTDHESGRVYSSTEVREHLGITEA